MLENITYCDIEAEGEKGVHVSHSTHPKSSLIDLRYVDPNIVKLFQLSQLLIEYLLHSQEYLIVNRQQVLDDIANLRKRHSDLMEEHDKVVSFLM